MAETPGSRKTLAGWTMVDSKGEVMSDDSRSVSSESSTESFSLLQEDSTRDAPAHPTASVELPSEEVNAEIEDMSSVPLFPSVPENQRCDEIPLPGEPEDGDSLQSSDQLSKSSELVQESSGFSEPLDDAQQQSVNETDLAVSQSAINATIHTDGLEENNEGLCACSEELMTSRGDTKNDGDVDERDDSAISSIRLDADDSISGPSFPDDGDVEPRQRHNSDSDSDFVQINEENLEELEAELSHNRHIIPDRSPSIAEGFNFLGPQGEGVRDELPVPGNGNLSDRDYDEDFNEDTESSTEDVGDDRIESDQSEVGSVMNNNPTDVGDLSAFADIGDLPLVVGNVARNYRHRPNKGLSSVLNVILIVVSLLTMGISIGLIMATDLEIQEWQNAYNMQVKKASSLEWTLADLNRDMQESKDKFNAYDSVLKSFSKAESGNAGTYSFFSSFADIVTSFESCIRKRGSLSSVDCHALVLPDIRQSLSQFKHITKTDNGESFDFTFGDISRKFASVLGGTPSKEHEKHDPSHEQDLHELRLSLQREQERAIHWQNLYLLERRQREWERENEDLEDQRERAQWEKEDEEEDRRMREVWEREEAENDRKERLLWEREDQEQDRLERERWEKERAEIDNVECLKKLMSTNLTFFRQHVVNWNISAFDDFVNMSTLMSGIAEMKQSVIASVQQIWVEAEQALNKMGEDVKKGKQPYLDTSIMADYLKQALTILRSQFDDVVHFKDDFSEKEKSSSNEGFETPKEKSKRGFEENYKNTAGEGWRNKKNKVSSMLGKIFKKTSKSLRKFVRSSWTKVVTHWENTASRFMKSGKTVPEDTENSLSLLPSWLQGRACQHLSNKQNIVVDIGSACLWDVRDSFANLLLQEHCDNQNRYSRACNIDANSVWQLKKDLVKILDMDGSFRASRMTVVDGPNILGLISEFWKKWENSELLLRSDKEWASCLLKEWSDAVYSKGGWTKATGRRCHRFVHLKAVFTDIDSRIEYPSDQSMKPVLESANTEENEYEGTVEKEDNGSDKGTKEINDKLNQNGLFHDEKDYVHDEDETGENPIYEDLDISEFGYDHYDYEDSEDDESVSKEKNSAGTAHGIKNGGNSSYKELNDEDNYKHTAWYLKRAQYRLQMRRAQEKATWFFDMSDHRNEMRKEHNVEKKSGQWLFDHAVDREFQRKKDNEADWVFDRARHRRKEFSRKWSHQPHKNKGQGDAEFCDPGDECGHRGRGGRLRNNRRGEVRGKQWKKKKYSFKNTHKTSNKSKKKNGNKHQKHLHHQRKQQKQHRNKNRLQKKSTKI